MSMAQGRTRHALLAERDDGEMATLRHLLRDLGYTVISAVDAPTALELARLQRVDLLVAELGLAMDGMGALVPRLRAEQPDLPVVAMAGELGACQTEPGRGLGGRTAVLHRPYSLDQFSFAVREVVPAV